MSRGPNASKIIEPLLGLLRPGIILFSVLCVAFLLNLGMAELVTSLSPAGRSRVKCIRDALLVTSLLGGTLIVVHTFLRKPRTFADARGRALVFAEVVSAVLLGVWYRIQLSDFSKLLEW